MVSAYFNDYRRDGIVSVPEEKVVLSLSTKLDESAFKVYGKFFDILGQTSEHKASVSVLNDLLDKKKYTVKKCSQKNAIFRSLNPLEQMFALDSWLKSPKHPIYNVCTMCFEVKTLGISPLKDYIPVKIATKTDKAPTSMNVVLGNSNGSKKAPKYSNWAEETPFAERDQEIFVHPLACLEIARRPERAAASLLKDAAMYSGLIENEWRWGPYFACVEEKGQYKNTAKMLASAGLNLTNFLSYFSDNSDPKVNELNICPPQNYMEYFDEGYHDYLEVKISPGEILLAIEESFAGRGENLDRMLELLSIHTIGPVTNPALQKHFQSVLESLPKEH
ncbi:MAG: hypothetical protein EBU93_05265 [Chlamydiae bacterium]|nr:hypothetical protein [Chlamydiota bacterium]